MTTLELRTSEGLRGHVHRLRRMRADGIELAVRRRLVGAETGEFVELLPLGARRWMVAVGDAKTRGPHGAEIALEVARHLVSRAVHVRHVGDLLVTANDLVHDAAGGEELVSAVVFVLDGARRTFRIANAGQVSPLAVGRGGGVVALEGRGPALGLLPEVSYGEAGPMRLGDGMVVLATTDGVHDAVDAEGRPFGVEGASRSLAVARERGPRAVVRRVLADVAVHGVAEEADDRTALAFSFRAT